MVKCCGAYRSTAHHPGLPPRYLLFVGAAQPRKGLDVLLEAHRSRPELAPLVLAGPASWGAALTSSSRVHTVGYLDDAGLRCAGNCPRLPQSPRLGRSRVKNSRFTRDEHSSQQ